MERKQPYWEEVEVGQELPGFELDITSRRMVLSISGSQDWYPIHFDAPYARKAGHEDVFVNTGFVQAALVRVLTDWMGDEGFLRRLYFEMRRQHRPGDTMACRGRVTEKEVRENLGCVDVEVWTENAREGVATPGQATVVLPFARPR
jgi:acyl dehydratase